VGPEVVHYGQSVNGFTITPRLDDQFIGNKVEGDQVAHVRLLIGKGAVIEADIRASK
jgi:hypothetical protein